MILDYNRKPDATVDEKVQSLMENTQLALNDIIRAQETADVAKDDAQTSVALSQTANQAAQNAVADAGRASEAAASAEATARGVEAIALHAEDAAEDAEASANEAKQSADTAFNQLSFIENIVGVLQLVAEHGQYGEAPEEEALPDKWYFTKQTDGTYAVVNNLAPSDSVYHLTSDEEIDADKHYYIRTGAGTEADPYVYTLVETPSQAELSTYYEKYYVLTGIDQSIQNYVSSHLVLTQTGLSLRSNGSIYTMDIDPDGLTIKGEGGKPVAVYGTNTIIGDKDKFHVKIDGTELGFYDGNVKVAYVRNNQLFIERSVVVEQMDIGYPVGQVNPSTGDTGKGQWSWKVHEVNGLNNLYLKWLG